MLLPFHPCKLLSMEAATLDSIIHMGDSEREKKTKTNIKTQAKYTIFLIKKSLLIRAQSNTESVSIHAKMIEKTLTDRYLQSTRNIVSTMSNNNSHSTFAPEFYNEISFHSDQTTEKKTTNPTKHVK